MGAGGGTTRDLHVHRRFALQQVIFPEKLLSDFDEALRSFRSRCRDAESLETSSQALVVETSRKGPTVDDAKHFVNAIAEDEAAILHRNARFGTRQNAAVYVNEIFGIHW